MFDGQMPPIDEFSPADRNAADAATLTAGLEKNDANRAVICRCLFGGAEKFEQCLIRLSVGYHLVP